MKEHIGAGSIAVDGTTLALCGVIVKKGEWKAGAAYEGLRILGMLASDFCPECSRVWLQLKNKVDGR